MENLLQSPITIILIAVVVIFVTLSALLARYKRCPSDKILVIYKDGTYELTNFDLTNHYEDKYFVLEKFDSERVVNAIHYDALNKSNILST